MMVPDHATPDLWTDRSLGAWKAYLEDLESDFLPRTEVVQIAAAVPFPLGPIWQRILH